MCKHNLTKRRQLKQKKIIKNERIKYAAIRGVFAPWKSKKKKTKSTPIVFDPISPLNLNIIIRRSPSECSGRHGTSINSTD